MFSSIAACIIALCLSHNLAYAGNVILLETNDSPPYWSETLPSGGLGAELVQAISRAAGLTTQIRFSPLKRLIEDDNNNDLGNPIFYMGKQEFECVVPFAVYYASIFYHKSRFNKPISVTKLSDLKGYKVGVLKGTVINRSMFKRAGVQLEESYTQASLFKKLKHGRIDLVVEIDLVGEYMIKQLFPNEVDDFMQVKLVHSASPLAMMIADNGINPPDLGARYAEGLRRIIASGEYNKILEHFYGMGKVPKNWYQQLNRFQRLYQIDFSEVNE